MTDFTGSTEIELNYLGILSFIALGVMLLLCFVGDKTEKTGKLKVAYIIGGVLCLCAAVHSITEANAVKEVFSLNVNFQFGFYLFILMAIAECVIPFLEIDFNTRISQ